MKKSILKGNLTNSLVLNIETVHRLAAGHRCDATHRRTHGFGTSACVFKIKSIVFLDTLIQKKLFQIMKINNFQGELTDVWLYENHCLELYPLALRCGAVCNKRVARGGWLVTSKSRIKI